MVNFIMNDKVFSTVGGEVATKLMQEHSADIILALKAHAILYVQRDDKERAQYLMELADKIYDALDSAEDELLGTDDVP